MQALSYVDLKRRSQNNRHLKHYDAFSRTWWSALSIDKLVTWQHLSIEKIGGHVVLKASSCLTFLLGDLSKKISRQDSGQSVSLLNYPRQ